MLHKLANPVIPQMPRFKVHEVSRDTFDYYHLDMQFEGGVVVDGFTVLGGGDNKKEFFLVTEHAES
jgi:hypothetical protein